MSHNFRSCDSRATVTCSRGNPSAESSGESPTGQLSVPGSTTHITGATHHMYRIARDRFIHHTNLANISFAETIDLTAEEVVVFVFAFPSIY